MTYERVNRIEWHVLGAVLLAALSLYAFAQTAAAVLEGETERFDRRILLALRNAADPSDPIGPAWFEEVMRDLTALGGTTILVLVTLATTGFLVMTQKRHAAVLVLGAVLTGVLLSHGLKWSFDRPRPDLVPHAAVVYTRSFPSGHAMLSAVVYLTLGALIARTQQEMRLKLYALTIAIALTVLVGVSRIYLGVHWPTDVLAGWVAGTAWAMLCWLLMQWLQRRGQVEPPGAESG